MSPVAAAFVGYIVGSIPTANPIAGIFGIDLRVEGSGNPGANNALRLGGYGLAGLILVIEIGKGVAAVMVGNAIAGQTGMIVAGIGAAAGNVFNVWYRFTGGKGLGIVLGVLLAAWPVAVAPAVLAIAVLVLITRSTGMAALGALALLITLGFLWSSMNWPSAWGVSRAELMPWLAIGIAVILLPKHFNDARGSLSPLP